MSVLIDEKLLVELQNIRRELKTIRQLASDAVNYIRGAEAEIPEMMRRFMNYMHDVHDIKYMYEEQGHPLPAYILRELERLDDRYRQLLSELHKDGNAFERVRRDMAEDKENRWDHTRRLEFKGGKL